MKIGVPKEVKNNEARVAMTPNGVGALVAEGHDVFIEHHAGMGSDFDDEQYIQAGAKIVDVAEAWDVELVVKVKEPQPEEYQYIKQQMIFTFFHFAGVEKSLTDCLLVSGATALAYESLEGEDGSLPILAPMSAVAGNMSVLMGAYYLASFNNGKGMQLGSILGKSYGEVLIIGDGVVGQHAARVASAMGATVKIAGLNKENWNARRLNSLDNIHFVESNQNNIAAILPEVDLVIGGVLCRGAKATKVLTEAMIKTMRAGSVVVDVSIDQGGCVETSKPTSHSDPVFIKHGVIHYCVANMPGAYPKASTMALTDVTLEYIKLLAGNGLAEFCSHPGRARSVNVYRGKIVYEQVARELHLMESFEPLLVR